MAEGDAHGDRWQHGDLRRARDLTTPTTSSVRYQDAAMVRELTTAPVTAVDSLPIVVDEEYAYAGGTLRIGHRDETDQEHLLDPPRHLRRVAGRAPCPPPPGDGGAGAALIAVLDTLTLTESDTGLAIEADGWSRPPPSW